ncbi:hypothetical protein LF41_1296 [Lysobacter dokdonensis DS-58]|uniref:Uncharacterized protein n=1 Tax=Lysobacter dokdonensis DS-58 TaxID=1300345 RepID=A0A0A2WKQ7_9GAMM|nr:hypothetical protein [Lysobacter dokdonensis]KGQ20756.1 hypothetical protein LF41_1296 [Lysobacter dokdonensis DS-58]
MARIPDCKPQPGGPRGPAGEPRLEPIDSAMAGIGGTVEQHSLAGADSYPHLQALPPLHWINSYLHSAELDYVNADVALCVEKLEWVTRLQSWCTLVSPGYADYVIDKARSIATNILAGRDVFGRDQTYVPLLSYDFLRDQVQRHIDNSRVVEGARDSLRSRLSDQILIRSEVNKTIAALASDSEMVKSRIQRNFELSREMLQQIESLRDDLDRVWHQLDAASENFKAALRRKSGGCGFSDALSFAAMVATVAATGGSALAVTAAASTSLSKLKAMKSAPPSATDSWYQPIVNDVKEIAKIVEPAGKSIEEFKKNYAKAKDAIDKLENPGVAQPQATKVSTDYIKLVANKSTFDVEIDKFREMPEAQTYKRLMDLFVATSETRNNKIIEHDNIVRDIWAGWAQIRTNVADSGALSASLQTDFELEDVTAALDRSLTQSKWNLIRSLSSLSRTLEYISGNAASAVYDDHSVGAIAATFDMIDAQYSSTLESLGQGAVEATNLSILLKDLLPADSIQRLIDGQAVMFSIPLDHPVFAGRYGVTARRIRVVELPTGANDMRVTFQHEGRSIMRFRDGSLRPFTHQQVRAIYQLDHKGAEIDVGELGERSGAFVGVSPFGPWKLQVNGPEKSRRAVTQSRVSFNVLSRPTPI